MFKIPGLPNPWLILGVVVAFIGYGEVRAYKAREAVRMEWRAEVNEANVAAMKEKARIDAENAAKDLAAAEHTRDLEAQYAREIEDMRRSGDNFRRVLNQRLRDAEARCSGRVVSSTAPDSGDVQDASNGGDDRRGRPDLEGADRLRNVAKTLQAQVKQCYAWMQEHGR